MKTIAEQLITEEVLELGERYLEAGRIRESQRILKEAVLMSPENARSHYLYGKSLLRDARRVQEAAVFLTNAVFLNPENEAYRQSLAEAAKHFWLSKKTLQVLYGASEQEVVAEQAAVAKTFADFRDRHQEAERQDVYDELPLLKAA